MKLQKVQGKLQDERQNRPANQEANVGRRDNASNRLVQQKLSIKSATNRSAPGGITNPSTLGYSTGARLAPINNEK